jgi:hypothetical protein
MEDINDEITAGSDDLCLVTLTAQNEGHEV